jgi:hypothetical protein
MEFDEYSLKLSKASEKNLQKEIRNKRKSRLFKNDENKDHNNIPSSEIPVPVNLKFKEEEYLLVSKECKFSLDQFEKLSVNDEGEDGVLATIKKDLDEPSPLFELVRNSKPRKLLFTDTCTIQPIETIASKKFK